MAMRDQWSSQQEDRNQLTPSVSSRRASLSVISAKIMHISKGSTTLEKPTHVLGASLWSEVPPPEQKSGLSSSQAASWDGQENKHRNSCHASITTAFILVIKCMHQWMVLYIVAKLHTQFSFVNTEFGLANTQTQAQSLHAYSKQVQLTDLNLHLVTAYIYATANPAGGSLLKIGNHPPFKDSSLESKQSRYYCWKVQHPFLQNGTPNQFSSNTGILNSLFNSDTLDWPSVTT